MKIVIIVTVARTWVFFRGTVQYVREQGFDVVLCSSDGRQLHEIADREHAEAVVIPMRQEISPLRDLVSSARVYRMLRREKPDIVLAASPKGALLGMLAAWFTRVPIRYYAQWGIRLETTRGMKRRILWWAEKITSWCATKVPGLD